MVLTRLRATLFASKLHAAATILLGLVLVVVLAVLFGVLGAPGVADVENRFGAVNETSTTIESDLVINNPNPIGVQLGGMTIDYAVSMNGLEMATGTRNGIDLGTGNSTIPLTTYLDNERIPAWWRSHIDNGERTTVGVNADVHSSLLGASVGAPTVEESIETDMTAAMNSSEPRPVNADVALIEDPVVYLNETSGSWGEVTETTTPIEMTFTIYNPKSYPVGVSELGYDVTMNGVRVGEGVTERSIVIPPGETRTIEASTVIDTENLDEWWVTHLERNQVTEMTIAFRARFDLSESGAGSVMVPLDSTTQTIETDIFGTKQAAPTTNEDASGSGVDTPTEGSGDATETGPTDPLDGGTETATASPTGGTATGDGDTPTPTDGPIDVALDGPGGSDDGRVAAADRSSHRDRSG